MCCAAVKLTRSMLHERVDVVAVVFKENLERAYHKAMQQSLQMENMLLEEEERKDVIRQHQHS